MTNEKALKLAEVADTLRELATLAQRLADLVSGLSEIEPQPSPANEGLVSEGQPQGQSKEAVPEPLIQASTGHSQFPPETGQRDFRRQGLGLPPRPKRERLRSWRMGRSHMNDRQPMFLLGQMVLFQNESTAGTPFPDLKAALTPPENVKTQPAKMGFDPAAMRDVKIWSGADQGSREILEPAPIISIRRGHGGDNEEGGEEDTKGEPTVAGIRNGPAITPSVKNHELEYGLQYKGSLGSDRDRGP